VIVRKPASQSIHASTAPSLPQFGEALTLRRSLLNEEPATGSEGNGGGGS